ncbi:MAG: hypothetical protein NTX03_10575 [Bacteroidetes bacterium]|nr:hypothetical protein [Bacteroidota bacterium]
MPTRFLLKDGTIKLRCLPAIRVTYIMHLLYMPAIRVTYTNRLHCLPPISVTLTKQLICLPAIRVTLSGESPACLPSMLPYLGVAKMRFLPFLLKKGFISLSPFSSGFVIQ